MGIPRCTLFSRHERMSPASSPAARIVHTVPIIFRIWFIMNDCPSSSTRTNSSSTTLSSLATSSPTSSPVCRLARTMSGSLTRILRMKRVIRASLGSPFGVKLWKDCVPSYMRNSARARSSASGVMRWARSRAAASGGIDLNMKNFSDEDASAAAAGPSSARAALVSPRSFRSPPRRLRLLVLLFLPAPPSGSPSASSASSAATIVSEAKGFGTGGSSAISLDGSAGASDVGRSSWNVAFGSSAYVGR
mmetsp:Transcript_6946/g.21756  ORF Transcript_6946/g.21756 Transcript_6946/m.21756 type:complete len:248 (-) Transcript_6946:527-1270(-)